MRKPADWTMFMTGRQNIKAPENWTSVTFLAQLVNTTSPSTTLIRVATTQGVKGPFEDHELHCEHGALLGPLGLFVQGLLAFIAFASLIVKRFCEPKPERRPWRIWFYDTSKQAIGAAAIHFANVFLADMFQGDPCTWYIVSFLLDSTVGLVVIYIGLQISQFIVKRNGCDSLILGEYGSPPQCSAWCGQCGLYILVMLIEKLLMTLLVLFDFWKEVRKFIMSPIQNPKLELIIVMFVVPFIVNAFIFWVVDNFLKRKKWKKVHTVAASSESGVKYFKTVGKVKYFNPAEHMDDSESDGLLSYDDETGESNKYLHSDRTDSQEEHRLLAPTVM